LGSTEDKLLFILVYTKTYPLQVVQGELFDMSQSSANTCIHTLLPVLRETLDRLGVLPERDGAQAAQAARRPGEPADLIVDGVERRRQRPKDPKIQAIHYSGKKKAHFDKNVVVVNTRSQQVSCLSPTLPGSVHDKALADYAKIEYPKHATLRSDSGFTGYAPSVRAHLQPKKVQEAPADAGRETAQSPSGASSTRSLESKSVAAPTIRTRCLASIQLRFPRDAVEPCPRWSQAYKVPRRGFEAIVTRHQIGSINNRQYQATDRILATITSTPPSCEAARLVSEDNHR
jgi:hypothetical protein